MAKVAILYLRNQYQALAAIDASNDNVGGRDKVRGGKALQAGDDEICISIHSCKMRRAYLRNQ